MTDLYLIAHRVRGEAAFDVAIMLDQLDEDGDVIWIIPTSGHRAYPYWHCELIDDGVTIGLEWVDRPESPPPMPPSHPDHYPCNDRPIRGAPTLLDRLNLRPTQPPIVRRI